MSTGDVEPIATLGLVAVVGLGLFLPAFRASSKNDVDYFAFVHGLRLDDTMRRVVLRGLTRSRRYRAAGTLFGLVAAGTVSALGVGGSGDVVLGGFLGFCLGAFVAALVPNLQGDPALRRAVIFRRASSDYLSLTARIAFPAAIAVTVLAAAVNALDRHPARPTASGSLIGAVAAVGGSAALTWIVVGIIVSRSQPAVSPALVAADDALRAEAVQRLAGAGLMVSFVTTLVALWIASFDAANLWIRAGGITIMLLIVALTIVGGVAARGPMLGVTRRPHGTRP